MSRRRAIPTLSLPTPLPDALPAVLVHVYFFDGLGDPEDLRWVKGYGAHDLVNTLGRLRRVSRYFKHLIDRTFSEWKRRLGVADVPGSNGFWLDLPCQTLYDLRGCAGRSCFVCAKQQDPRGRWGEFAGVLKRVTSEGEVRDVPLLCCTRCQDRYFADRDANVAAAFENAEDAPPFFKNTCTPPTPFERFSGVVHHMCLARNALFQAYKLARHQSRARHGIELQLVRKAKKKDVRIQVLRRLGVRSHSCEHVRDYTWDVEFGVSLQGVVSERFLKKAAALSIVVDHFVPHDEINFGSTWQSDLVADAFVSEVDSYDMPQMRKRLRTMKWLGSRPVVCTLLGVRFFTTRSHGLREMYHRSFDSMAVWVALEAVPAAAPRAPYPPGISGRLECVVDGKWLHDHFVERDLPEMREASVDAQLLADERRWNVDPAAAHGVDRFGFNRAVVENTAYHEKRVFAALQRRHAAFRVRGFSTVLGFTIDRDFQLLLRLANPQDPRVAPRRLTRGFPAFYLDRADRVDLLLPK